MTLEIDRLKRKARYTANKFARENWPDVMRVTLGSVTAWEDPKGYSVWTVERQDDNEDTFIKVTNFTWTVEVWS